MLFVYPYKTLFSLFSFPIIMMHILNIVSAIEIMAIKELRGFIYENWINELS